MREAAPGQPGVGVGLVADGDPDPVKQPSVLLVAVEPIAVAAVTQPNDRIEQRLEFEQDVTIRPDVTGQSGVAATRSGLTFALDSTRSENKPTSAPSI